MYSADLTFMNFDRRTDLDSVRSKDRNIQFLVKLLDRNEIK